MKERQQMTSSLGVQIARGFFPFAASLIFLVLTEWVARGELTGEIWTEYILPHLASYILSWLFLFLIWMVVDTITRLAPVVDKWADGDRSEADKVAG